MPPTTRKAVGPDGDVVISGLPLWWIDVGGGHFAPVYSDKEKGVVYALAGVRIPRTAVPRIHDPLHKAHVLDPTELGWRVIEVDQPLDFVWATQHGAAAGFFVGGGGEYFLLLKGVRTFSEEEVSRICKPDTGMVIDPTTSWVTVLEVETSEHVKDRLRRATVRGATLPTTVPAR